MHTQATGHRLPPLGLAGLFLAFANVVALIPYVIKTAFIRLRRLRSGATTFRCPASNQVNAWKLPAGIRAQVLDDVRVEKDLGRWDRAQSVPVIRAKCGTVFTFDEKTREFIVAELGPASVRA